MLRQFSRLDQHTCNNYIGSTSRPHAVAPLAALVQLSAISTVRGTPPIPLTYPIQIPPLPLLVICLFMSTFRFCHC